MSICRVFSCVVGRWEFALTSAFSWQKSISLCPASFCIPRPNLPVTPGISWLPTFAFQSPIMKRTSFLCKTSTSALLPMPKPLSVNHNRLWKILQEMVIPDHLTCLLRNLYSDQEAQNWTWKNRPVPNWERVHQGCILSPCLLYLNSEYIMQNA